MKLLIALHHRFELWQAPPWFSERLRQDFPQLKVVHLSNYDRVTEEIADADIAISWSLRGEQIKAAEKLKWIHSTATAVHALMSPELRDSEIVVTNARDVHGPVVAEHAHGPDPGSRQANAASRQVSAAETLGAAGFVGCESSSARVEWRDHDGCRIGRHREAAGQVGSRVWHASGGRAGASSAGMSKPWTWFTDSTSSTRRCARRTSSCSLCRSRRRRIT